MDTSPHNQQLLRVSRKVADSIQSIHGEHPGLFQFADDTAILAKRETTDFATRNHGKTKIILIGRRRPKQDVIDIRNKGVQFSSSVPYLGATLDRNRHVKRRMGLAKKYMDNYFRFYVKRVY